MYKVVIIDDEELIRRGLIAFVDWAGCDCIVCGEANSGIKGFELIKEVKPDIIITDIQMSGMTGLEMISMVKNVLPKANLIILSGYRNFSYAQEAIRLGVFRFLLKPTDPKEVFDTVCDLIKSIENEKISEVENSQTPQNSAVDNIEYLNAIGERLILAIKTKDSSLMKKSFNEIKIASKELNINTAEIQTFFIKTILAINRIRLTLIDDDHAGKDLNSLYRLVAECDDIEVLVELLTEVAESIMNRVESFARNSMNQNAQMAIKFVCEHYSEQITLQDIADELGISANYVSRIFKKEIKKNLIEFLSEIRIEHAKKLLLNPQAKIYEVSEEVGVLDSHYFSKLFKKYAEVSPSEYRAQNNIFEK